MAEHWTAEPNGNFDPPFVIYYDRTPGGTANDDGTTSHALKIPELLATDWPEDPGKLLEHVAACLNVDGAKDRLIAELDAANKIMLAALKLAMRHGTISDSEDRMNAVGHAIGVGEGLMELYT